MRNKPPHMHIGKMFLTGFSANIFHYRDVCINIYVKIRSFVQVFRSSYYVRMHTGIYYIQYVCLNIHQKFSFITCASSTRKINCTCILRTGDGVHQHFDAVTNRFTEQHLGIGPVIVWISCGFNKIWVWKYNVVFTRGAFSIFAISGSSIAIEWMRTF